MHGLPNFHIVNRLSCQKKNSLTIDRVGNEFVSQNTPPVQHVSLLSDLRYPE